MNEPPSVFVAGLGLMGRPIARTLAGSGLAVRGWNRTRLEPELVDGIDVAPELGEASGADVVLLVLLDTGAVGEVLARLEPSLGPGQVVVDVTTSWPVDSVERAARLSARAVGWVDAPVSGGPPGVLARELAVLAGGEAVHVERVRPLLERLGRVTHVGGPGAGHTMKLVNQAITSLYVEAVAEGLALAERAGLDLGLVHEALAGSAADSRILRIQGRRMASRHFAPAARATVLLKDLELISRLAAELGLDLPHVASTRALYEELVARGHGGLDVSALYTLRVDARGER